MITTVGIRISSTVRIMIHLHGCEHQATLPVIVEVAQMSYQAANACPRLGSTKPTLLAL